MPHMTDDWSMPPAEVTDADAALLLAAARSEDHAVYGDSTATKQARSARRLGHLGLLRWVGHEEGRWSRGMWVAYLTCPGWNALWRHFGVTHIDGCGSAWSPDGTCSGCRVRRRLDRAAWTAWLDTLDPAERSVETARSALWCPEHGYVRMVDRTTKKVCQLPGTPLHDGGLNRVGA